MVRRLLAAGSAASVIAALGVAVSAAGAAAGTHSSIAFSSQSATLSLVTSFSRTPAGTGTSVASGNVGSSANQGDGADTAAKNFSTLTPKGNDRFRTSNHATGGVATAASPVAASSTPAASSSFAGQASSPITCHYFLVGCNPPDMGLGAGPNFVLEGVNTQWAVYNTSGALQPGWPVSAQNFFGAPNTTLADGTPCDTEHLSQPFLSDPRALYDPVGGRYWASMLQVEDALGIADSTVAATPCPFLSVIWVAVSQTGDPSGAWNVYEFNTSIDGQFANDYDQIGVNGNGVFVSANMFGPNNGFYAEVFAADKAQMEAGTSSFAIHAFFNMQGTGPGTRRFGSNFLADTVQPAMNYDSSAGADETFVDTVDGPDLNNGHLCGFNGGGFNQACSGLVVWKMHDPLGSPTFTGTYVATAPFLLAPPQTQPSCAQCVDSLDLRITGTPVIRNGVLYGSWDTALTNAGQTVAGLEWAAVDLSSNSATTGYFSDSSHDNGSATFGALMPDAHGNVTMVFDHMSSTTNPEIRYITMAAGATNFSGQGVLLRAGDSSYRPERCGTSIIPVCRWGDYEATSFDGAGHIWFSSQYANLYGGLHDAQNGRNWSTWIGAIAAS